MLVVGSATPKVLEDLGKQGVVEWIVSWEKEKKTFTTSRQVKNTGGGTGGI